MLIVANWKMQKTHNESIAWCQSNKNKLIELVQETSHTIVLCPSFIDLTGVNEFFKDTAISVGAQNCAPVELGACTGNISVLSLQEIGCSYCIIGHGECRLDFTEDSDLIARKLELLLKYNIKPIICIGETENARNNGSTKEFLEKQLEPIIKVLEVSNVRMPIYIAYEPIWAIGSGKIPEFAELQNTINWINQYMQERYAQKIASEINILYGGSVTEENIKTLREIKGIKGFLLGKASLDFQILKKIVLLI